MTEIRHAADQGGTPVSPASARVAIACGFGAAAIGVSGLVGWAFNLPVLRDIVPGLKPIAISASIVSILLGGVLALCATPCRRRWTMLALIVDVLVVLFCLAEITQLVTGLPVSIEDAILRRFPALYHNPLAHIAPIAMGIYSLAGLGQALYIASWVGAARARSSAARVAVIGMLVMLGGVISILGYLYGTPALLGREVIPISFLAALAGLLLGIGLVVLAGDGVFPLNQLAGSSTYARLLRAFLPLTAALMLALSLAQFLLTRGTLLNPILVAVLLITLFEILIVLVIRHIARGIGTAVDQANRERRMAEEALRDLNATLEDRVRARTAELAATNRELETFSYSVAHDLRSPLRGLDGFSQYLLEHYADCLDARGQDYLRRMRAAAQRMGRLIDDLLNLARVGRATMRTTAVDLSALATTLIDQLRQRDPARRVTVEIAPGMVVTGDAALLKIALGNLVENAWKFTSKRDDARIIMGQDTRGHQRIYCVRDNGAGFDMAYADKLFLPFHRLHREEEYPGTGIGLSLVRRIIERHHGRVWAEGEVNHGATVYFTLGDAPRPEAPASTGAMNVHADASTVLLPEQ